MITYSGDALRALGSTEGIARIKVRPVNAGILIEIEYADFDTRYSLGMYTRNEYWFYGEDWFDGNEKAYFKLTVDLGTMAYPLPWKKSDKGCDCILLLEQNQVFHR